ncbi:RDD family protein [Mucilaginibacter gotjawali]|uniref:RDD family protein n=2 Tax=Mucilaginibacter gotjawali TaxID=1550579 RepID=A0A110B2W1_9SPHI|nr:RDD family protein [Mucilaginibacter gotjawali]MBB3057942.1 putative RDD family membrane protein YckC [Mucilaginibacter gotjawali]BAU52286.1 RDD family protein [Mucilaginibacter gotjawali]
MIFHKVEYKRYVKLRIFATLIDYSIYLTIFFLYCYVFGVKNPDGAMEVNGLPALPLFIFWFLYFPGTEAINQATPGHDICKLIVVRTNGDKISFWDAFKRRVVDPIDIMFYGIPALICICNTPKFQRLGDLLADTVVVKKSDIIETEVTF